MDRLGKVDPRSGDLARLQELLQVIGGWGSIAHDQYSGQTDPRNRYGTDTLYDEGVPYNALNEFGMRRRFPPEAPTPVAEPAPTAEPTPEGTPESFMKFLQMLMGRG